jgi:hypothetical protein
LAKQYRVVIRVPLPHNALLPKSQFAQKYLRLNISPARLRRNPAARQLCIGIMKYRPKHRFIGPFARRAGDGRLDIAAIKMVVDDAGNYFPIMRDANRAVFRKIIDIIAQQLANKIRHNGIMVI